jgi:hypothetical protein
MNNTAVVTAESSPHHAAPVAAAPPAVAAPAVAAPAMTDVFGKPALLHDEDANLYDALFSRVVAAARPRDPFEWMLLKDYADLAWEIFRLRRAKAGIVNGARKSALVVILNRFGLNVLAAMKFHSDPDTRALILQQLADQGLDEDIITQEAVSNCTGRLAALDRLIASAEHRRNAMLREIDYHRGGLATRLRDAPDVIDAESEDVPRSSGDPAVAANASSA